MEKLKNKKIEKLEKQIEELKKMNSDLENNWKRSLADLQNYKKRAEAEKLEFIKFANQNLLQEILPVLDNLEMVVVHLDDMGLKVTVNQFRDTLKRIGVKELEVLNSDFDVHTCEAIDTVESDKDNVVLEVLQKGYSYNDKVIRPAKVKVGKVKN